MTEENKISEQGLEQLPEPNVLSALIDRWFVERIHNSPVSRSTEIYNYVHEAVADLKKRLEARS